MKIANEIVLICLVLFSYYYLFCAAFEAITIGKPISDDGELLICKGRKFALGFFNPGKSSSHYVGIWYYNLPKQTVVWVANRDNPINDTSGVLSLSTDGNLILHHNNTNLPIWSTNVFVSVSSTRVMAQLSDVGNLVLIQNDSKTVFWESFDHPTDTFLPYAKLGFNKRTGQGWFLQSWKTDDDPATGSISARFNTSGKSQLFLYKQNIPVWRVGPFNGEIFVGLKALKRLMMYTFNISIKEDDNEVNVTYNALDNASIFKIVAIPSGFMQMQIWDYDKKDWNRYAFYPQVDCENYGTCGPNSNCDSYNFGYHMCTCLPGFEPRNKEDWYQNDQSVDCVRKKGPPLCRNGEGFVKVESVKIPDTSIANVRKGLSMEKCEQECLRNCSCTAYAAADVRNGGSGCLAWHGALMDTMVLNEEGHDIYVRVDAIELANYNRKSRGILSVSRIVGILMATIVVVVILIAVCVHYFQMKKKRDKMAQQQINIESTSEEEHGENSTQVSLQFFNIKTIQVATNGFSSENELGHGGFGSVYKGLLVNGQEIAVKRLSQHSGQGIEEFKNEIKLIAKLQHRNLVRLFGHCIHKEERMLIYEYLPNKSLDFYLFDMHQRSFLDWDKRVHIIFGITRGLLYLHHDSRLKIIHRDLKASNVLLDATMNPKISDFGMARIFGEDQIQAITRRIVGTYGYMSPEYAMEGQYSIKSDIFSFGILLLEIISGRRNIDREKEGSYLNLIGRIWNLWGEGKALEIVDSTLGESYPVDVVLRYIKIGLLCVQEIAIHRPSMTEVIFMLGHEVSLPSPQKPAFLLNPHDLHSEISTSKEASANILTHSTIDGR